MLTEDASMATVGDYIKAKMHAAGLTYEQLEALTGISRSTLNNLVTGRNKKTIPQLPTLAALSQALNVPLYELVEALGFDLGMPPGATDDATTALYTLNRLDPQQRIQVFESLQPTLKASIRALMVALFAEAAEQR